MSTNKSEKSGANKVGKTTEKQEKTAANKLTEKSGLSFNVNTVKANMKSYFENQSVQLPMFSGSHVAMTAVIQKMAEFVLKACMSHLSKDKTGIKQVARPTVKTVVCLNTDMNEYFYQKMLKFKKNNMYSEQIPVSRKEFDVMCTTIDKSLALTPKAYNFLCYLLNEVYLDVLSTSYQFLSYAKKKTLDATVVMYAIKNRFSDNLAHELCAEVTKVMAAVGDEVEKVADDEDHDDEKQQETGAEDSGDEGDTKDTKESKEADKKNVKSQKKQDKPSTTKNTGKEDKNAKQSGKKQQAKIEEEDEEEDEEDEDKLVQEDEEDEEDDEEPKKETKKQEAPKKSTQNKKTNRATK